MVRIENKWLDLLKERLIIMKLICGDSLQIIKEIPDNSIDLIVTDPPYKLDRINTGGSINNVKKLNQSLSDLTSRQDLIHGYDIEEYGNEIIRVMKDINVYFWCNKVQIPLYLNYYVNKLGCKFEIICWHKPNALPTYANKYLSDTEYLLYFRKGKGHCFPKSYDDAKTYYISNINYADKKKWNHPTIKPLDITEKIIRNCSNEGDVVLDLFMGSGTTGVACKNLNRNFIGIEIDKQYYNISVERIMNGGD